MNIKKLAKDFGCKAMEEIARLNPPCKLSIKNNRLTLNVKIKTLPNFDGLELPKYQTSGCSGMDLYAAIDQDIKILSGCSVYIPTGICLEIPEGYEAQIRSRSGLAKKSNITVLNSPGTIDSSYRGEIGILLINHSFIINRTTEYSNEGVATLGKPELLNLSFTVHRGDRVAQLVFAPIVEANLVLVDELSDTDRGEGGFGSTGK